MRLKGQGSSTVSLAIGVWQDSDVCNEKVAGTHSMEIQLHLLNLVLTYINGAPRLDCASSGRFTVVRGVVSSRSPVSTEQIRTSIP